MTDEPILKTPGELLAEAREASGCSLAEISTRTKIPVPQLQAVERDEYHRLSGPLYVKSFLRAYAEAVGVEVATVLDLYRRSSGEGAAAPGTAQPDVWESETVRITRVGVDWGRLLAWGAGGAAVVVAVWLLLRLLGGGGGDAAPPRSNPAPVPAATGQTPPADPGDAAVDRGRDSLAAAWQAGPAAAETSRPAAAEVPPAAAPAARPAATDPEPSAARDQLPPALSGAGPIPFAGGGRWPVRVRVLAASPVGVEVRCDGESAFRAARYGPADAGEPALPARRIEPGRAYAVREGVVVYWAAQDHCGLRLDRTDGVEITVNGQARDISRLRPGQEIILDAHR